MGKLFNDPIISVLLIVILIGFLVYRQIKPCKLSLSSLVIFPAIIIYFIIQSIPTFQPNAIKLLEIGISSIVSITLGSLACRQLHVYKGSTGKAMAKGSWTYFLWWLAAFVIKSVLSVSFGETSSKNINQIEILLPVFFLLVTRNIYLYWRTSQLKLELH